MNKTLLQLSRLLAAAAFGAVAQVSVAADVNYGVIRGLTTSNLAYDSGLLQKKLAAVGHQLKWRGPYGGTPYDALNAGQVDITFTTSTNAAAVVLGDTRFKIFAYQAPDLDGEGVWVKKSSNIKTLADLKGRRIATDRGASGNHVLLKTLEKAGLTLKDVQVSYFDPPEALAAFNGGQVEALATWRTFGVSAEARGDGVKLSTGREVGSENLLIYIVRTDFANKHPEAVRAVFDALQESARQSAANPEATAEVWARLGKLPLDSARLLVPPASRTVEFVTPALLPTLKNAGDLFVKYGVIPRSPNYEGFIFDVSKLPSKSG